MTTVLIDPPGGYMYGFPRRYNREKDGDYASFLLKHGYPEKNLDLALHYSWVTQIEDDDEDISNP